MSYTLKREGQDAHGHSAGYLTPQPISLRRVSIAVSIGSVLIFSVAGLPSLTRHVRPRPPTDGLHHTLELTCHAELQRAFADLIQPVDPATHQRPAYPPAGELLARLQPIGHWETAVLFMVDAGIDELQAAGAGAPEVCLDLDHGRPHGLPNPVRMMVLWQLALLDAEGRVLGRTLLSVPLPQVERCAIEADADMAALPLLEKRFPDWPRVTVFKRPASVSPSDG
jgi:hypothetical protein